MKGYATCTTGIKNLLSTTVPYALFYAKPFHGCALFEFFVAMPSVVPAARRGKAHGLPSATDCVTIVPTDIAVGLAMASHGKLRGNVHGKPQG